MEKSKRGSKLSQLYKQLEKAQQRQKKLREDSKILQEQLRLLNRRIKAITGKIGKLNTRDIAVCPHFVERYILRVGENLTPDQIKVKVLTPKVMEMIDTLGNGTYPWENYSIAVKDRTLITIY